MKLNSTIVNFFKIFATLMVFFCHSVICASESFQTHGLIYLFNTPAWGGVWTFLIISGLLASLGFSTGKYQLAKDSVKKYYRGRFIKVLLPTWIFLTLVFIFNMRDSTLKWDVIIRILTCTYNGGFTGIKGAGATWYVFMLMWLYLLTPMFVLWLQKYEVKHRGKEFKAYLKLLGCVMLIGLSYRIGGYFLHLDLYNWLYANVIACLDLYVAGMIGERMIKYFPREKLVWLVKIRSILLFNFIMMNLAFIGINAFKMLNLFYRYISPTLYITFIIILVLLYSDYTKKSKFFEGAFGKVCNIICPFSFAFYLWHSSLLGAVADSFEWILDAYKHYAVMLVVGFFVVSYVSYLMTKMNDSIIKTININ